MAEHQSVSKRGNFDRPHILAINSTLPTYTSLLESWFRSTWLPRRSLCCSLTAMAAVRERSVTWCVRSELATAVPVSTPHLSWSRLFPAYCISLIILFNMVSNTRNNRAYPDRLSIVFRCDTSSRMSPEIWTTEDVQIAEVHFLQIERYPDRDRRW